MKRTTCQMLIMELLAAIEHAPELGNNYPISDNADSESFIYNFIATVARPQHRVDNLDSKSQYYDDALTEELEQQFSGCYSCSLPEAYGVKNEGLLWAVGIFTSILASECK
jgi:hypothetical protein